MTPWQAGRIPGTKSFRSDPAKVSPGVTIEIPSPTLSRNQLDKMHWAARNRIRSGYQMAIRAVLRQIGWQKSNARCPMLIKITRFAPRKLDHDNFVGGCKGLVDALVGEGVLVDDSPSWCSIVYEQAKARHDESRTVIDFRELS